jgi:hypothetical protein
MPWTIDDSFKIPDNKAIVDFITRHTTLSAHDDVAESLTRSAQNLSDVGWYSPDVHSYAYFVLHTRSNRILGIAFGQRSVAYRLPRQRIAEAVAEGGKVCSEIGEEWIVLDPWQATKPVDLQRWCKIAHDYAIGAEAPSPPRT